MKKIIFTKDQLNDIYNMYQKGNSLRIIQEKFGVSQTVLNRIFKENNWKLRKKTDHMTLYSVNEHVFDQIDTPDKAYCMGLFYADGCNHIKEGNISIELQSRDRAVLEGINRITNNTRPIKTYPGGKNLRKQDTCVLVIHSFYLSNRMNELGFIPRKSLSLDFPNWITKELFPFFLKGYIDGDGWVQKYVIGFMSSDKFCYGVQKYLIDNYGIDSKVMDMKRHYSEHTKTLYICNRKNLYPLTELMFSKETIGIPRKIQRYIEYGFLKENINNSLSA